jgi:20S proteasome subunit beta 7
VLAAKYGGGVMVLADTLGSYGSLARFADLRRIQSVNDKTIVAASGDFADFQHILKLLTQLRSPTNPFLTP